MLHQAFEPSARAVSAPESLLNSIAAAEARIVTIIERECAALRSGQHLAAKALRGRLKEAAELYLNATLEARARLGSMDECAPDMRSRLERRRDGFAALLRVELAVLATIRAAAGEQNSELAA